MVKCLVKTPSKVDIKYATIDLKVRDEGVYSLLNADKDLILQREGYVPSFIPGEFGDYIRMTIDLDTGQIMDWMVPTSNELERYIEEE